MQLPVGHVPPCLERGASATQPGIPGPGKRRTSTQVLSRGEIVRYEDAVEIDLAS